MTCRVTQFLQAYYINTQILQEINEPIEARVQSARERPKVVSVELSEAQGGGCSGSATRIATPNSLGN